jgi:hypothetical protein
MIDISADGDKWIGCDHAVAVVHQNKKINIRFTQVAG